MYRYISAYEYIVILVHMIVSLYLCIWLYRYISAYDYIVILVHKIVSLY